MSFTPPREILERYAEVMVNYGLGNGGGIEPSEVVGIVCAEDAKPLLLEVAKAVWRAGGHAIIDFRPADDGDWNLNAAFYDLAAEDQLDFYPDAWRRAYFAEIDHYLVLIASRDPRSGVGIDPTRASRHSRARSAESAYRFEQVKAGRLTWSGCVYGTEGTAGEAGMTIQEYWDQIIHACYLDQPDPVEQWRRTAEEIRRTVAWLNQLDIDRLHIAADGTDLWVSVGEHRRWTGGDSVNVPSFEIATSPDWRGTSGSITFTEPLYHRGVLIRDVRLSFRDGTVVQATAEEGEDELGALVATDPGAARIGEFSLTDGRHSRITRFMANTMFDENRGGPTGNTHLALGQSYGELFTGDLVNTPPERLAALGFNQSGIHVDIVSTSDRSVTATLRDGSTMPIYAGGRFLND
jgi:aminopeptidase